MSQADLKGRWALILGASSGFGAATARELAANGVNIIGLHLDRGAGLEAVKTVLVPELEATGVKVWYSNTNIASDEKRAEAIVKATTFYTDPDVIAKVSRGLGEAMVGINVEDIPQPHRLAERGW